MISLNTSGVGTANTGSLPPVYFDPSTGRYFVRNKQGEWMSVTYATAESYVVFLGHSRQIEKGESQSESEQLMLRIQLEKSVHYAGPLAGYKVGPHLIGSTRVLVTKPVRPVMPAPGDWPVLRQLLTNMFGDEQLVYLLGWIKQSLDMLRSGKHRPGQALAVCGPAGAGKSLLGSVLTALFGGEPGHPWKYMNDKTQFNSDLFGSVLLLIDDAAESVDIRARRAFAAHIKQMVVVRSQPCHKKYAEQISLQPLWRLMILLNDDPERLMVLPPLDADIEDKIMLFKAEHRLMPMPTGTPDEAEAFMSTMVDELPAFVHELDNWTVPADLANPRYGIDRYHHPDVARDLDLTSPEARLREMIDEVIFGSIKAGLRPEPWEGKAVELERMLVDKKSPCTREAERLLPAGGAVCGKYLGRLAKQEAARFSQRKDDGLTVWIIQPPMQASTSNYAGVPDAVAARVRTKAESQRVSAARSDLAGDAEDGLAVGGPTEQSEGVQSAEADLAPAF